MGKEQGWLWGTVAQGSGASGCLAQLEHAVMPCPQFRVSGCTMVAVALALSVASAKSKCSLPSAQVMLPVRPAFALPKPELSHPHKMLTLSNPTSPCHYSPTYAERAPDACACPLPLCTPVPCLGFLGVKQ